MEHILWIHCPDESGLIAKITSVLFQHRLNITENTEFVERDANRFFMRTQFTGLQPGMDIQKSLRAVLPGGAEIRLTPQTKKSIVILATKEHHCIGDLLLRHHFNELKANIAAVLSNYDNLEELVQKFGIAFHYITHQDKDREAHEAQLLQAIQQYQPEYLVLAKYMRILSPRFIALYSNRIINIHHSFLPAFIGANPYAQAYARGVKIIGATAHFVNNDLDEGPIITQNVLHVNHTHNAKEMAQAGREVEKQVLAHALRLVFDDRVFVHGNKTIVFE